ncbi:insulinase family protein [Pseudomonas sp. 7P_10.2_Bac1]|uniref:M16 family metallopeptidase n=1 Tax=Pseudomonas sp. 7P_10.2_Bac1 TaxID=2971614 RepID=UPI0021C81C9B|nr:pitrilysin family protein [Pseudomonas sp. 7P_10.2_Bac1]MCU1729330.1 insulinase family protein [Pseudomonas sp. 7P_10.2_Bac1]
MKLPVWVRWLITLWLPATVYANTPPTTHVFTLENGLKVIVREDHRAPVVASQLWYKVGASYEQEGQTGVSHALEHLLFKGSSKLQAGEALTVLESLGVSANATTRPDATFYTQLQASNRLAVSLEILADQMASAHWSQAQLHAERVIIQRERRTTVDINLWHLLNERLKTIAHVASTYKNPVLGWMHDINRLDNTAITQWYQDGYVPNNAVLVIVGDVTREQVKTLVTEQFGALAARPLPPARPPIELANPGRRTLHLRLPSPNAKLAMAFNVPSLNTAKDPQTAFGLLLLNELLSRSDCAPIKARLMHQQGLLAGMYSHYDLLSRGDGLLRIWADISPSRSETPEAVEKLIWAQLNALKTLPVSAQTLERAKRRLTAQRLYDHDQIEKQASEIGELESVGLPWSTLDTQASALQALTAADIQRLANTYLTENRLSSVYIPGPEKKHD